MQANQKIPKGWSVKKLGDICLLTSGGTPSKATISYWKNGDIKWLSAKYIEDDKIVGCEYITKEAVDNSASKLTKKGDIILVTRVSVGKIILCEEEFAVNQDLTIISSKQDLPNFLFYSLKNKTQIIVNKSQGLAIKGITKDELKELNLLLPPLAEQKKIAEILGTWDEAIEKLSSLIEQKKLLKKGLMQKLLTGKVRLPGFTQPWKEVKLGDFLKEHTEKTTENDQYQVLSVTKNGICSQEEYFEKQIASENNIGYKILRKHDIVFSPMNLWMGSIGFSEYDIGIVSPAYKIFSVNENVALFSFLKHFMIINRMIYLYLINSEQGASIVRRNLDLDGLLSSKVSIPDITEQQAIADVLSAADDEINLLNKKLEALKEQKKGLMQQLLTGQIRVKVN